MKIIVTKYDSHFGVRVEDKDGLLLYSNAFASKEEVEAFGSGFGVAKMISNNLIQSLPMGYEVK